MFEGTGVKKWPMLTGGVKSRLKVAKMGVSKIIQKSRKEEVEFLFPVWDRWNHNKHSVQKTPPVIAQFYNKVWWPSGKDTWLSRRWSGFNPRWDLFDEKFFHCLCFTNKLIPESRNLYLSTPMDDFNPKARSSAWHFLNFPWFITCFKGD